MVSLAQLPIQVGAHNGCQCDIAERLTRDNRDTRPRSTTGNPDDGNGGENLDGLAAPSASSTWYKLTLAGGAPTGRGGGGSGRPYYDPARDPHR